MSLQHRLSEIDPETLLARCAIDGPVSIRRHGERYLCDVRVRERIKAQEKTRTARDRSLRYPARRAVAARIERGRCERCPFVAEDLCQLDADHIVRRVDGGGDDPSNIYVLCANCHRLKSKLERTHGLGFDVDRFMRMA